MFRQLFSKRRSSVFFVMSLMLASSTWPIQAAPTSSAPSDYAVIRQVTIDEHNVIAYIKDDGVYTFGRAGRMLRQVAVGDEAPRTGGRFAQFLDLDSATVSTGIFGDELRIVFKAAIEGGTVGVGVFLFTEVRGVETIALPGDIAPDTGSGAFDDFPGRVLISRQGTIMFKATVTGGTAIQGLFFVPRGFLLGEDEIESVAIQGDPAPETGAGAFANFETYDIVEDALAPIPALKLDRFAFIATVEGGQVSQGLFLTTFILVRALPLQVELQTRAVSVVGNQAGGLRGSMITAFKDLVLTKQELVFSAALEGVEATEGIFQVAFIIPGLIELAQVKALAGARAPVAGANVTFSQFERLVANDEEQLVFGAILQGTGPNQGLFLVTLGPLTLMSETVSINARAPGTDGGVYGHFGPIGINDDGFIVFQADIEGGTMSEGVFRSLARQDRFIDGVPR